MSGSGPPAASDPTAPDQALADNQALWSGRAVVARPRDVVVVSGPDAAAYLQGQCSQDVADLAPGQPVDALLLAPDGKLDALVRITRTGPEEFVLDADGGTGEAVAARLRRFLLRTKAEVTARPWTAVALRGAGWTGRLPAPSEQAPLVLPFAWGGWTGADLLGPDPAAAVPFDARWVDPEAAEAARIEAGVPVMGRDLDHRTIAAEAGLVERAVSLTKGCYTGQELVARLDARGSRVARHLRGLVIVGPVDPESVVGAELTVPGADRPVGTCTSAAWSADQSAVVALAMVHRSVEPGTRVVLSTPGPVEAEVRALPLRTA
jgi:folate-binding protein YgfZ